MATVQVPRYPLDKDAAGNAAWKVLHNFAAQYPDAPSAEDKKEFHSLIKSVLRTIPDSDCRCRTHAVEYIQKNPPTMNSRKELIEYVCNFHNSVNTRAQKPVVDCKVLLDNTAECDSCKVSPIPKKVVEAADVDGPLKQTLGDYKHMSVKVIEELCKREGLPIPRIVFAPCPVAQNTSCNIMIKDKDDVVIKQDEKAPVIYLNPTNFGLRVLVHEWNEYRRQMKHTGKYLPKDEETIEKHTQEIIHKYFPADSYDTGVKKLVAPIVMKDESAPSPSSTLTPTPVPNPESNKKINQFMQNNTTLRGRQAFSTLDTFPMFSKYRDNKEKAQEEQEKIDTEGGILSHLDSLFEPIAKFVSLKPRDVNLATTPTIFSEGSQFAIRSQLSEFGSLLVTSALGIGLVVATAFNKDSINTADRRLLTQLAGLYLWSGLRSASSPQVLADAHEIGTSLANFDFSSIPIYLVNQDSFLASFVGETLASDQQKKGVSKRKEQRKQGRGSGSRLGGGLGGGSGGGRGIGGLEGDVQGRGDGRDRGLGRDQRVGLSDDVIARLQQRAMGDIKPHEDVGSFRDFPTGVGPRQQPSIGSPGSSSYGGPGFAAVRSDSSGGAGFTYVPSIAPSALSSDERDLLEAMGLPTEASSAFPTRFYYDDEEDLV